jgi:hypothetical protein
MRNGKRGAPKPTAAEGRLWPACCLEAVRAIVTLPTLSGNSRAEPGRRKADAQAVCGTGAPWANANRRRLERR